jgi:cation diffusion facilitator CzcD-associated flavoprotein CzcO
MTEHLDVLVIGAGISGIGAGHHLQKRCPQKRYAILEGRADLGGTWDLFRYPGIRSDSDMYTLGYAFKPWTEPKDIADAANIMAYLRETAAEFDIDKHIRYQHQVTKAEWDSQAQHWTLTIDRGLEGDTITMSCNFLFFCSGYYNYKKGYTPEFADSEKFSGELVHPQFWPEDLNYQDKKVIVIGSGATAITLVPAMTDKADHVTLLQRSPTYIASRPGKDPIAEKLRKVLPKSWVYPIVRWKNILSGMFLFWYIKKRPEKISNFFINEVKSELGPDFDVDKHFTPSYKPWDQRLCLVPDGDLFAAIRSGKAGIETDHIDRFTESGILLKSGKTMDADIIVSATGLDMDTTAGLEMFVDGKKINQHEHFVYKGMMFSDIPNAIYANGYTNASWTLKVDLTCRYVCRLINYMDRRGYKECVARNKDPELSGEPLMDFSSGYIQRALEKLPQQGSKSPWKLYQNYLFDFFTLGFSRLKDKAMEFR